MKQRIVFDENDKLSDLICQDYSLLMVMSRFGFSLGFGDKTVGEVCEMQGVDCNTFLAVVNFITKGETFPLKEEEISFSLTSLMDYLKQAHTYFLDFNLPAIRRKLIEAINCSGEDEVSLLILKFFDEYVREVRLHMEYEDKTVFTYVEGLIEGRGSKEYDIATFANNHSQVEMKLTELKNIIIKYYPEKKNNNLLNAVLFDIFNCEQDLIVHCDVENCMFIPAVSVLERKMLKEGKLGAEQPNATTLKGQEILSEREIDVLRCVVKGMTNKAIADCLCLSVHTIITHRRNIARKLEIHSPAGLTIYAIVNKLVDIEEVKLN
ncbi:MAG: helix-turn-helix transcriptional regulator [Bacteroides sp.]|nr:helix-turn-helix transcriptional regulator [Bacteroides sp.]